MLETAEFALEKLYSTIEDEEEEDDDEEEQRDMFEKAGLMLEKLALNAKEEEEIPTIPELLLDDLVATYRTEQAGTDHEDTEKTQNNFTNLDEAIETMLKNKEEELEAIMLETDNIFEILNPQSKEENEKKLEPTETNAEKLEETQDEKTTITNIEINEKAKDEIKEVQINNEEGVNTETLENEESSNKEEQIDTSELKENEEAINILLSKVQSRQNLLQEKMQELKASTESLKEQLIAEKLKWKQELKETIGLQKKLKIEKEIKEQHMKHQAWMYNEDDVHTKMDYVFYKNSTINIERELKRRNYQTWLAEISNECDKQLIKVQSNLSVLKPLKEIASKWNYEDRKTLSAPTWLTNNTPINHDINNFYQKEEEHTITEIFKSKKLIVEEEQVTTDVEEDKNKKIESAIEETTDNKCEQKEIENEDKTIDDVKEEFNMENYKKCELVTTLWRAEYTM